MTVSCSCSRCFRPVCLSISLFIHLHGLDEDKEGKKERKREGKRMKVREREEPVVFLSIHMYVWMYMLCMVVWGPSWVSNVYRRQLKMSRRNVLSFFLPSFFGGTFLSLALPKRNTKRRLRRL
ncbi:hypothetical protein CSUI_005401 [Cystoisospora suis]|uniref:Transmembrane protein n=1 Tax=Cystoisospora suis TaxID=483139 RepID=A0A2C6K6D8_9APIC|nr:hypothetical protein CSUI_005401 [Cystoisospora suis]